jgi:ATP-binding cassette subfamily B protein
MKQHKTNKLNIPIEKKPAFYSLRRTLSWLKKYRVVLIVSMILGLISAAIYALIPLAASTLLEKINEMADEKTDISTTYEEVVKTGILVICAYLFALILQLTSIIINCIIGINTSKTTRNVLINKLDSLPLVYFDTHACGTVNDIIINNTQEIGVNTTLSMSNLINNTVQAITVFIGMIVIS